jgi:[acyl-carrier-protein] S-malonyltransferase
VKRIALLFPGQGMEGTPRGPDGRWLTRTDEIQPWLVAESLRVAARLDKAGVRAVAVAGHSVGELAAWAAAGGLSFGVAVEIAAARGALMAREAEAHPGRMLALDGDAPVCPPGAVIACRNAPQKWVLSGSRDALASLQRAPGARWLAVTGAWHSPLMAGALDELRTLLQRVPATPTHTRWLSNRDGRAARDADIPTLIAEQLVHPVDWAATMRTLDELAVTDYVTVGPGRILRGLVRANLGARTRVHTTEDDADFARTLAAVS